MKNPDGTETVPGILVRFANSLSYVTSYQVWETPNPAAPTAEEPAGSHGNVPDLLSYVQRKSHGAITIPGKDITFKDIPDAIGSVVEIEGLYNWNEEEMEIYKEADKQLPGDGWIALVGCDLFNDSKMGSSHLFPSIYYGMLHGPGWNLYDRNNPR